MPCKCRKCKGEACQCMNCKDKAECSYPHVGECRWERIFGGEKK